MEKCRYPVLDVNLDAVAQNAKCFCDLCGSYGIRVAGVVKFSDGDVNIAEAYTRGGCAQIAVSRAVHLKAIKEAHPHIQTLLTRTPTMGDMEDAARYGDLILCTAEASLRALDAAAAQWGTRPGVLLMLDVGDLREGVDNIEELCRLAVLVEKELPHLCLKGVGSALACLSGVLPSWENLSFLVEGVEAVEARIGRKLEIISGGSSINLILLKDGSNKMPSRINHLRLGGSIANPMNIRINRGVVLPGLREDSMTLTAEIVEICEKDSAPKVSTLNWAGEKITAQDKGRRLRAIVALGSQDVADAKKLLPVEPGVQVVGCSSDHTILDITDSPRKWQIGDTVTFELRYDNMLTAFSGKHVAIRYYHDQN